MSDEERIFAEEYHVIVQRFLRYKGLNPLDFYDIVIFGYLEAVEAYCRNEKLREQYSFNAIAWRRMLGSLHDYYKYIYSKKRQAVVYSLDMEFEDGSMLKDYIGITSEDFDWIIEKADAYGLFTDIELYILCSIYAGETLASIRQRLGLTWIKFRKIQIAIINKVLDKAVIDKKIIVLKAMPVKKIRLYRKPQLYLNDESRIITLPYVVAMTDERNFESLFSNYKLDYSQEGSNGEV